MEQEPKPAAKNPYQHELLIEQSHGDDELLHRLAARQMAASWLEAEPDNSTWKTLFESVNTAVAERQLQLGITLTNESTDKPDS